MKKQQKIIYVILVVVTLMAIVYAILQFFLPSNLTDSTKPKVIDYFACGDYCPGPKEQYMVKVYEGVITKEECDKTGGTLDSFIGWGTTYYCKVAK